MTTVTLSDGASCEVRRLRIFELRQAIEPPLYGYFTYDVEVGGRTVTAVYEPPEIPPTVTSDDPNIAIWQQNEVDYYRAWQAHEDTKRRDPERYACDVAEYIITNCISEGDKRRIVTPEDYAAVYLAALTPSVTMQELESAASRVFHAKFDNQPLFKAMMGNGNTGDGEHDIVAVWEVETMHQSGLTEQLWAELPLGERARRIVGSKLSEWQSGLQMSKDRDRRGKF